MIGYIFLGASPLLWKGWGIANVRKSGKRVQSRKQSQVKGIERGTTIDMLSTKSKETDNSCRMLGLRLESYAAPRNSTPSLVEAVLGSGQARHFL